MRMNQIIIVAETGCGAGESRQRQTGRIQQRDSENHDTAFYTCTIINMAIISIIKYTHTNTVAHKALLNKKC